jgi:LPS O-antigen subunit length determinant protein (WzzB/FepE family)
VEPPDFPSDVPTFKGNNRYNYQCFLLSMELHFEINSYYFTTYDRKVRSATQKLSERILREWLENQQYIARPYRWQDFDAFLLRQLANPDAQRSTTQAYRKYYLASQRENQSVREFANFTYKLEMWLEEEFNDQRRINYLDAKVLPEVREESFKYKFNVPTDYTSFVWHLQGIENTLKHRRDALSTKSRKMQRRPGLCAAEESFDKATSGTPTLWGSTP